MNSIKHTVEVMRAQAALIAARRNKTMELTQN